MYGYTEPDKMQAVVRGDKRLGKKKFFRLPPAAMVELLFGITAMVIVALGARLAIDAQRGRAQVEQATQLHRLCDTLFGLGTALAYERGLTARLFVGDDRRDDLNTQREAVETLWREAQDEAQGLPHAIAEQLGITTGVSRIGGDLVRVRRLRDAIDPLSHTSPDSGLFFAWVSTSTGVISRIGVLREQLLIAAGGNDESSQSLTPMKRMLWDLAEDIGRLRVFISYYASAGVPVPVSVSEDLRQRIESLNGSLLDLSELQVSAENDETLRWQLGELEHGLRVFLPMVEREVTALEGGRGEFGGDRLFDLATDAVNAARAVASAQSELSRQTLVRLRAKLRLRLVLYIAFAVTALALAWRSLNHVRTLATDLFVQKELAETTLQSIGDAVVATDAQGIIEYLNPVAEHLVGWTLAEARGRRFDEVFRIVNHLHASQADPVGTCLRQGMVVGLSSGHSLVRRDGGETRIEDSAAPIRDRDNKIVGAVVVFFAIDNQPKDHLLVYQATRDALTGLINRREFERRLNDLVASAKLLGEQHVLGYMDLDQFKIVNDTCGHAAGDDMLRQVVFVLRKRVRGSDVLGRLGGDEIGLLLYNCGMEQAQELAETLRLAIREFRFRVQGQVFECGLSIGLVPVTATSISGEELLSQADAACYMAKEKGRNRVHIYDQSDLDMARHQGEMQWVPRLGEALREDRFELHGQRICPLAPDLPEHIEILVRLRNPDGTLVPPMTFIPAAERYGLIGEIDRWVIKRTFAAMACLPEASRSTIFNINLSGNSLGDHSLIDLIHEQAKSHGIAPDRVCFEITETAAIRNLESATELMEALTQDGYGFALDDFGSGLSSFNYLKSLPVRTIKIDGAFVRRLSEDSLDYVMVQSTVSIGRLLGMRTVAEFVESEATLSILRQLGVDYAQGFHLNRPAPLEQLLGG